MKKTEEKTAEQLEKELNKKKKRNITLYKMYEPFAWDLIFYYVVEYLFFTQVKGYNSSQILFLGSVYLATKLLCQIPGYVCVSKFGKKKMLVVGNIALLIYLTLFMITPNIYVSIIAQMFFGIAFCFKDSCESDLLYDSLPDVDHKGKAFSKIESKTNSMYYIIDMIASIIAGYMFMYNPYIPIIVTLCVNVYCLAIATQFTEICKPDKVDSFKSEVRNMRIAFRAMAKSKRLTDLIRFDSLMMAMITTFVSIRSIVLLRSGVGEAEFGSIFALMQIVGALSAGNAERFHNKHRNRTLRDLCVPFGFAFLFSGLILYTKIDPQIKSIIAIMCILISFYSRSSYYILIKKYLKNFTDARKREKIATAKSISNNIMQVVFLGLSSFITANVSEEFAITFIGGLSVILMVLQLDRMRYTVGKKPEEYSKSDIL